MARKFDFLSPGVDIREVDQSILPAEVTEEGPIIIGRFRKGPAMKPVVVRSLEDFVSVFGNPVPGGMSGQADIWRDGNTTAPTYAAYAAQAWLASEQSPVNIVRLLGDNHAQGTADGAAGWMLSGSTPTSLVGTNSTAYGLFVINNTGVDDIKAAFLDNAVKINDGGAAAGGDIFFITVPTSIGGSGNETQIQLKAEFTAAASIAVDVIEVKTEQADAATLTDMIVKAINGDTDTDNIRYSSASGTNVSEGIKGISALEGSTGTNYIKLVAGIVGTTGNAVNLFSTTATHVAGTTFANNSGGDLSDGDLTLAGGAGVNTAGALAAVFYLHEGKMELSGAIAGSTNTGQMMGEMFKSEVTNDQFTAVITPSDSNIATEKITFNFNRNSSNYIRNVFNTNPQLMHDNRMSASPIVSSNSKKCYWLGESFKRHLDNKVTVDTTGGQYAVLLPMHSGAAGTAAGNWSYRLESFKAAQSGWVLAHDNGTATGYNARTTAEKLFRVVALHEGEHLQNNVLIAIEDLKLPNNPSVDQYSSFTLKVVDINGGTLEKYSGLNLNPSSLDFVGARIGTQYFSWDNTNRRYRKHGEHPNTSDFIRIELYGDVGSNGPNNPQALPFGFFGPIRPIGFIARDGVAEVSLSSSSTLTKYSAAYVQADNRDDTFIGGHTNATAETIKFGDLAGMSALFVWPSMTLRVSGSDGYASNPYKSYFGIRPTIDTNSSIIDPDYPDYVRRGPSGLGMYDEVSNKSEYSFIFTLDDIRIVNDVITHVSGSRQQASTNKSYTADTALNTDGAAGLLNKGVKQFLMPMWGGFDGLEIQEKDPFRHGLIGGTLAETSNHVQYTLNKAIDSVADPEVVPANLMVMPGVKEPLITSKMLRVAENRKDLLAIIDLEGDYKPKTESTESATLRTGSVSDTISNLKTRNLNTSYGCCFYPWVQVTDTLNNSERVWVPASVAALGGMAQSQAASAPWFAPAGFNRGGLGNLGGRSGPRVIQAVSRLDTSERDDLYVQNINPIAQFPNEGVVIFGQKTLQQTPSALDRINVRRLMIYLKSKIGAIARNLLFEQNVEATWSRFRGQVEPVLSDVMARFGLTDYKLVLDKTTTTADLIDRNIMYAKIFLKPARAIEFIAIDFIITRTGAEFV